MLRFALVIVLIPFLTATVRGQDFEPFGDLSGTLTLTGSFSVDGPDPEDDLIETIELFSGDPVGPLLFDSSEGNWAGVRIEADWTGRVDSTLIPDSQAPHYSTIDGYEWEFLVRGEGDDLQYGSARLEATIELTEWTTISLHVVTRGATLPTFSASIASLEAVSSPSRAGFTTWGNLADGFYNRSVVVAPGTYELEVLGWISCWTHCVEPNPIDATVRFQFEPGTCPGDVNGDGILDYGDIYRYIALFLAEC